MYISCSKWGAIYQLQLTGTVWSVGVQHVFQYLCRCCDKSIKTLRASRHERVRWVVPLGKRRLLFVVVKLWIVLTGINTYPLLPWLCSFWRWWTISRLLTNSRVISHVNKLPFRPRPLPMPHPRYSTWSDRPSSHDSAAECRADDYISWTLDTKGLSVKYTRAVIFPFKVCRRWRTFLTSPIQLWVSIKNDCILWYWVLNWLSTVTLICT